jgi:hypothetical protein
MGRDNDESPSSKPGRQVATLGGGDALHRGTWARVTIDEFRHLALQNCTGHRASTNLILVLSMADRRHLRRQLDRRLRRLPPPRTVRLHLERRRGLAGLSKNILLVVDALCP